MDEHLIPARQSLLYGVCGREPHSHLDGKTDHLANLVEQETLPQQPHTQILISHRNHLDVHNVSNSSLVVDVHAASEVPKIMRSNKFLNLRPQRVRRYLKLPYLFREIVLVVASVGIRPGVEPHDHAIDKHHTDARGEMLVEQIGKSKLIQVV